MLSYLLKLLYLVVFSILVIFVYYKIFDFHIETFVWYTQYVVGMIILYACYKAYHFVLGKKEISENSAIVIDVRDAYRYRGESEPIDLVAGHIPGAINIPFSENLDENGEFLSPEILKEKYQNLLADASAPLSMTKKLIIHCGSGVTACHTILALDYAGFVTLSTDRKSADEVLEVPNLYVGSWSEWSRRDGKEIAKEV